MSMQARVSIIICTRNRAESLRRTLHAISAVEVPQNIVCELLVVDNGSSDFTTDVVAAFANSKVKISYLQEPKLGLCHARNLGLKTAGGEIVLFTDDDVEPPEDWIDKMCRPITQGVADAVAGEIEPPANLERPWLKGFLRTLVSCTKHEPHIDLVGANMAFRRSILEVIPQFDVELDAGAIGLGGDTLFSYQVEAAGFKIHRARDATVIHHFDPARLGTKAFLESAAKSGRSIAYIDYHWRHANLPMPRWNYLSFATRLLARRVVFGWRCRGIRPWEITYTRKVSFYREVIRMRGTRRKYDRFGFRKHDVAVDFSG